MERMWQRAVREQLQRFVACHGGLVNSGSMHTALLLRGAVQQQQRAVAPRFVRRAASQCQQTMGFATQSGRKKPTSFAIAEAFDGLYDDEERDDDGEDGGSARNRSSSRDGAESDDDTKKLSKDFLLAMEKKKKWMQKLAQERKFDHIVKTVYDCYAPLYAQQPALVGATSSLTKFFDEKSVDTKYQPRLFNDTLTKITEQEALALLVSAKQGPLAVAVFEHRRELARRLGSPLIVPGDSVMGDTEIDLASHFRSFYSWGMGAYNLANNHDKIFALYQEALDAGVYPTVSMNASYLKSLISKRRSEDVLAFYQDVLKHNRPTNVFFYRNMLFFANISHNAGLLLQLLDDMKIKGFKLRADDYLNAIKTFDDRYYLKPMKSKNRHEEMLTTPLDNYSTCVERMHDQEDHPELYQDLEDAVHSVVALFEEMVEEERITPTHEQFFPRAISAAVYLGEFEKAISFLELHGKHCETPLHHSGVRMAVNAFLLLDEPGKAWTLVRRAFPKLDQREFAHVANILEYLCIKNNMREVVSLLDDAKKLQILPFFSNNTVKILLPALIRNVDTVSDEQLWEIVAKFEKVFNVRSKPYAFSQFLNECCFRKRLSAAKIALQARDAKRVGGVKGHLGLRMINLFSETGDFEFVLEIFESIDLKAAKRDDIVEICYAVIRASVELGRSERCKRVYESHLKPHVANIADLPSDIRAALEH